MVCKLLYGKDGRPFEMFFICIHNVKEVYVFSTPIFLALTCVVSFLAMARNISMMTNGIVSEHQTTFHTLYLHIFNSKKPAGDMMRHLELMEYQTLYSLTVTPFTSCRNWLYGHNSKNTVS
jgi:hypothetical protein